MNATVQEQMRADAADFRRLGNALLGSGSVEEAIDCYRRAASIEPDNVRTHNNLGQALAKLGRTGEAIESFQRALSLDPDYAIGCNNLGMALFAAGEFEASLENCRKAAILQPSLAEAHFNCGNALCKLERAAEALESYDRAIALQPGLAQAHAARGTVLHELQRFDEALESYQYAQALQPNFLSAACNEAAALLESGRLAQAVDRCDRILALHPESARAHNVRGGALRGLGRHSEAAQSFARVRHIDPNFELALGRTVHARQNCCDWTGYKTCIQELDEEISQGRNVANPFSILSVIASAERQLGCARIFARGDRHTAIAPPRHSCSSTDSRPIRLAYLSGDLGEHPVSYLLAGVFEQHDRRRFETTALSLKPREESPMGSRVHAAFDRFVDVSRYNDREVAELMRALEIDIAVDLVGFTQHVRLGILAQHAAPVQINYLGFPGTMGAPYIDYILGDDFLIPSESRRWYAEQIAYLPDCFQANDDKRVVAPSPTRAQAGLPENGFVYCSFNASHKITPEIFSVWCRLLIAVENSVLWLVSDNETVRGNLRREAAIRGVNASRLIFASRQPYATHLGRFALADLFLDTLPFNGGATVSDALWAGVPVITCAGETFAARMGGSLLRAVGFDELITHRLDDYERLALDLAGDPYRMSRLRVLLGERRRSAPLFDTGRFCRHLEAAYIHMYARTRRGLGPETFDLRAEEHL